MSYNTLIEIIDSIFWNVARARRYRGCAHGTVEDSLNVAYSFKAYGLLESLKAISKNDIVVLNDDILKRIEIDIDKVNITDLEIIKHDIEALIYKQKSEVNKNHGYFDTDNIDYCKHYLIRSNSIK